MSLPPSENLFLWRASEHVANEPRQISLTRFKRAHHFSSNSSIKEQALFELDEYGSMTLKRRPHCAFMMMPCWLKDPSLDSGLTEEPMTTLMEFYHGQSDWAM